MHDPSQLSRIMTKRTQVQFFFSKLTFFGQVATIQRESILSSGSAWSTKIEYFWVTSWPSSAYWIIKRHRRMLKVPPNFQDYPWFLSGVLIGEFCVKLGNIWIYGLKMAIKCRCFLLIWYHTSKIPPKIISTHSDLWETMVLRFSILPWRHDDSPTLWWWY